LGENEMKLNRAIRSKTWRGAAWVILGSCFAVGAMAQSGSVPALSLHQPGVQGQRKSTDPPARATGKLGQDLFLAIDHRDLKSVQALIKKGADPNSRNGLELTPLHIAAASWQMDVMQALLGAGAQPDAPSTYGTPLTFAAVSGDFPGAGILISKGANVNTARTDGITVLMMAANSGSPELVGGLLKGGADVNAKNECDATALNYAARSGFDKVGRMLLDAGATVDSDNIEGLTPLMEAARNGHTAFVRLLLEKGAKVDAKDSNGQTALILAAGAGDYPEVIRALLGAKANPGATDKKGRSAAALANARGYRASAALLSKPTAAALAAVGRAPSPREAVTRSLKSLESSSGEFSRMTACISCHHEGLGRIATGSARDHGFSLDKDLMKIQAQRIGGALMAMKPLHDRALVDPETMKQIPLIEMNEVSTVDTWLLAGMAAHHVPPSDAAAAMTMVLARQQSPAGFWSFSLPRTPMQSSFFTFTALAVRSLNAYAPKSSSAETAGRIHRARTWLQTAPAKSSEDRASRLLGLKWSGATKGDLRKAMSAVRADQRPDGGWSQLPGLHSDAYATGQALYALHVGGGMPVSDPAYKRGVQYLLRTQDQDGTWFVCKRAIPANNYFDAGFPHGESQYASFNATSWATLALLETIDSKSKH
jgi:ankyrin repeat protein